MNHQPKNFAKEKLNAGQAVVGTWSIVASPVMSEICASAGLDFIFLDLEHGVFDLPTLENCIRACEAKGCSPLVRIPRVSDPVAQNIMDMGTHGIVVPQVLDFESASTAAKSLKFPPEGHRGYNPFTRAGNYKGVPGDGLNPLQNNFALNILLIETKGAYRDLDRILEIPGVDALYLGVYDMSQALGCPGQFDNPEMVKFVETSLAKIRKAGKVAGAMFKTTPELKRLKDLGANLLVYGVDSWVYSQAMNEPVKLVNEVFNRRS